MCIYSAHFVQTPDRPLLDAGLQTACKILMTLFGYKQQCLSVMEFFFLFMGGGREQMAVGDIWVRK